MKRVIEFLKQLADNNNREWFQQHKSDYQHAKAIFDDFTLAIVAGIREFDESIGNLSIADCTYRIYRDTRFSQDKRPYKTHMGAFICPGGKKSGFSGYYFQVGPSERGYDSGCMLASGNYYYETPVLKLLREDIALDDGKEFQNILDKAKGFELDWEGALKRVPREYDAEAPYAQWLKLRNFCLVKEPGLRYMQSKDLLRCVLDDFKSTQPFLDFVNRAISYSRSET